MKKLLMEESRDELLEELMKIVEEALIERMVESPMELLLKESLMEFLEELLINLWEKSLKEPLVEEALNAFLKNTMKQI